MMIRYIGLLLFFTVVIGLPNKRFDTDDRKDELQKVKLGEILKNRILDKILDLQLNETLVTLDENQTDTSNQTCERKRISGDDIDSFFGHPDPDSDLANLMESFVIEDNGEQNTSHHPKGIEKIENMNSKSIGEKHEVEMTLPPDNTDLLDTRGKNYLEKRSFPYYSTLWPGGVIPYEVDASLNDATSTINEAIKQIHDKTCIRWISRSSPEAQGLGHNHYIKLVAASGCSSFVGMIGWNKPQQINLLKPTCINIESISHEMLHALGEKHEMARSDRDNYITMNWANINIPKWNANLVKTATKNYTPYNLGSILQYGLFAWRKKDGRTMIPKDSRLDFLVYSENGLTFYDAKTLSMAYKCGAKCTNQAKCKNDGYLLQDCTCLCPAHLTGASCETLLTDQDCGGTVNLDYLQSRNITSPSYPNNYPLNKICVWLIRAPVGSFVKLTINEFDIAYNGRACYHWFEVRYNLIGQPGPKFCGKMNKQSITTTKDGFPNLMMLVFNSSTTNRTATKGFNVTVKAVGSGCAYDPCMLGNCTADDNGNYTCSCDGGVSGATCNILNGNTTVNCTFEDGSHCFLINSPSDDFNWIRETTYTITNNTGPSLAREGSKYLYIESSPPRVKGNKAVMVSNVDFKSGEHCVTMWYHMYGADIGSLVVKVSNTIMWSRSGNQGDSWRNVYLNVTIAAGQKLSIEGEVGGKKGDIAIDDLKVFPAACGCASTNCKNGGSCSIQDGIPTCSCPVGISGAECEKSVCDTNDCMHGDCTTNPNDGSSYLCACQPGMSGKLCDTLIGSQTVSCTFEPGEPCCMFNLTKTDTFDWSLQTGRTPSWYTGPWSAHGGKYYSFIEASYIRPGSYATLLSMKLSGKIRCLNFWYHMYGGGTGSLNVSLSGNLVWSLAGDQGNQWKAAYVDIPGSDTYQVEITGIRGSYYTGDIAIDDIDISYGTCACKSKPCIHGKCHDDLSRPSWYNCTCDKSFVGKNCDTPVCKTNPCVTNADCSPDLTSANGYRCVCKPGYVGDDCHADACTKNDCRYGTCVTTGSSSYKCICDSGFSDKYCTTADGTVTLSCDFEPNSPCFLENTYAGDFCDADWKLCTAAAASNFQPIAKKGQYYLCNPSDYLKSFCSLDLKPNVIFEAADRCLEFWYYMYQTAASLPDLPAKLEVRNNSTKLWNKEGNKGNEWQEGRVNLPKSENFKLILSGQTTYIPWGSIALDHIRISPGKCD